MRSITFCQAINEALHEEMSRDSNVFLYGLDVTDHKQIFGSTKGLVEAFGSERCFGTPLSEDAMTGFGLGTAINGLRPIHVHIRGRQKAYHLYKYIPNHISDILVRYSCINPIFSINRFV